MAVLESLERINALWKAEEQRRKEKTYPRNFPELPEIPTERYFSNTFFELEKNTLWQKTWLLVGHGNEVPETGSYRTVDILDIPIFFARNNQGVIQAFYNTCQHRGARLLHDATGKKSSFLCPYHAWNYALDGTLKFVPDEADFPNLKKCNRSLKSLRCETLGNLIFICLDDNVQPLTDFLGGIADMISDIPWDKTRLYKAFDFEVDCNWKFIHDAFSETYHIQFVHKNSVNQALNRVFTARQMLKNGHNAMVVKNRAGENGDAQSNVLDRAPIQSADSHSSTVQLNPVTRKGQRSYNIFPNITIPVAENISTIMVMSPQARDKSTVRLYYIKIDPAAPIDTRVDQETVEAFNAVLQEDFDALTGIQKAAKNNALPSVKLGYGEQFICNFHQHLDETIGKENIPPELRIEDVELPLVS
ncbi:MAG: aromatic ring-hydroxylating dioxygenase subunit alpha [Porticoccaceae bacterium]|nr:aromatic ring-hydroxylating dioxygenase subunit alpha [Pseudomonadales bacterium]MCP5172169.1 aromatic ring-hydroxylating dioxygenase subunit alpha [Pseudomonadales bacterium]